MAWGAGGSPCVQEDQDQDSAYLSGTQDGHAAYFAFESDTLVDRTLRR